AMAALGLLANLDIPERDTALADFHARWRDDPLVLDKWYMVQAQSRLPDTLDRVAKLRAAPEFEIDNPNRVRALIGAFCHGNPLHFHAPDGSGYRFFADQVLALNGINAQIAARLLTAIDQWRRYMPACQTHARAALERIVAAQGLTRDVYEIASKTLDAPEASGS
ncbi:MAG TPA: aminopeptidase N, partial [Alphaproteobacteria bacterium]|nr:aminopeptidase N [Alphaproteobacteria bacterium]